MPNRWFRPLLAATLMVSAPAVAEAQELRHAFLGAPRTPGLSRPWSSLNFGVLVPVVKPILETRRTSRYYPPLDESPWQHVPFPTGKPGGLVHAREFEVSPFAAPIDCAMAKPGDPTLDSKIIRPAPTHRAHSGVIIPVAPCRAK